MSKLKILSNKKTRDLWFNEAEKLISACSTQIGVFDTARPKKELQSIYFFRTLGVRIQQLITDIEYLESEFGGKDETKRHQG